jgi:uncharacterized membrane protein YfcA
VIAAFLFFVAWVGGVLNAVAGGGSFLALPALLYAGVAPVSANATTTMALWPGSVSSAFAYRRDIEMIGTRRLIALGAVSLVGGLLGGYLLIRTSDASFMRLLPWLMLLAAGTFTFGGRLTRRFRRHPADGADGPRALGGVAFWTLALQLVIAMYGGYFGGGIGIMMLATMTVAGMTEIHEMNGLKSVLAIAINGVALFEFFVHGAIAWRYGLVMVAGGFTGGYFGAAVARRIPPAYIRGFVVVVGWTMTAFFFLRR